MFISSIFHLPNHHTGDALSSGGACVEDFNVLQFLKAMRPFGAALNEVQFVPEMEFVCLFTFAFYLRIRSSVMSHVIGRLWWSER